MNKAFKSYIFLFIIFIFVLVLPFVISCFSHYFKSYMNFIFLILKSFIVISIVFLVVDFFTIIDCYHKKNMNKSQILFIHIGLKILFPVLIFLSKIFKSKGSSILIFYIEINNIYVKSLMQKKHPDSILILLPHCLQNPNCKIKVANSIMNCSKCLECDIGKSLVLSEKFNISSIEVVSGGTSARSVVKKTRPEFIIAVACERDLASGIFDIKKIPVFAIFNQRPNGPCYDTRMSIPELDDILSLITNSN